MKAEKSIFNTAELLEAVVSLGINTRHVQALQRLAYLGCISFPGTSSQGHDGDLDGVTPDAGSKTPLLKEDLVRYGSNARFLASSLPAGLLDQLVFGLGFGLKTRVESLHWSEDKKTAKLLIRVASGALVETVIMKYEEETAKKDLKSSNDAGQDRECVPKLSKKRTTVCVSSQVGCKMACKFCATGTMGFHGNLAAHEILEQVHYANAIEKIDNIVFMGMGEPFDNYNELVLAVNALTDQKVFHFGPANVCVSTVGVVSRIIEFTAACPRVRIALSLHAPTQKLRERIVPMAKAYNLDKLMDAVDTYLLMNDRIMIEYILIKNINCNSESAYDLGNLLKSRAVILNLIPYNPTETKEVFERPSDEEIASFELILRTEFKIRTTVRRTMGQGIDGACGQLVISQFKKNSLAETTSNENSLSAKKGPFCSKDIEDIVNSSKVSRSKEPPYAVHRRKPESDPKIDGPGSHDQHDKVILSEIVWDNLQNARSSREEPNTQKRALLHLACLLLAVIGVRVLSHFAAFWLKSFLPQQNTQV